MNDHLTAELSRQLHDQVDDWHSAPLTLESVQGRARSIRRRRAAAGAGIAAAAVLAVILPVTLALGGSPDSQRPDVTNTPTQAVDSENPIPDSPLGVPFVEGRTLTLPDGAQGRLPEAYQGGTVLGESVFGLRSDDSGNTVLDELGADLQVVESVPVDTGFVPNLEGDAIAYVSEGELTIRWEDGLTSLGKVGPVELVRLVGGPDCTLGADDCVVYFNDGETPRFLNNSGEGAEISGRPLKVKDADDERRVALLTKVTQTAEELGSCGAVVDQQVGGEVFSTCKFSLGRFSPTGDHLSGTQPYEDGFGDAYHVILDARTGEEVARYNVSPGGAVYYSVWEDPEHLLVLSYEDDDWLVTRLGVDGSTETALPRVTGIQEEPAYVLLGAAF